MVLVVVWCGLGKAFTDQCFLQLLRVLGLLDCGWSCLGQGLSGYRVHAWLFVLLVVNRPGGSWRGQVVRRFVGAKLADCWALSVGLREVSFNLNWRRS